MHLNPKTSPSTNLSAAGHNCQTLSMHYETQWPDELLFRQKQVARAVNFPPAAVIVSFETSKRRSGPRGFSNRQDSCLPAQCETCREANRHVADTNMTTNSNLLLLILLLSLAGSTAASTLLIAGHSSNNIYKYRLARQLIPDYDNLLGNGGGDADFLEFVTKPFEGKTRESHELVSQFHTTQVQGNFTSLVISRLGTDQMSLDHIQVFYDYIKKDQELLLIEIGECTIQTQALLNKGSVCWAQAQAEIGSPNTAYLCDQFDPHHIRGIIDLAELRIGDELVRADWQEHQPRPFWPHIFASAAKADKKQKKKQVEIEVEEEAVEEDDDETDEEHETQTAAHRESNEDVKKSLGKKLQCKYRKSCYETGERPEIASDFSFWSSSNEVASDNEDENDSDGDGIPDDMDEDTEITARKLSCKYRTSCYKDKNIPISEKDLEKMNGNVGSETDAVPAKGRKRTLKEIAEKNMEKMRAAEERAAARPLSQSIIVERKLHDIEEKLNEKLHCKYRKSCYETGTVPDIDDTWKSFSFFTEGEKDQKKEEVEVDFKDMEEDEQKFYCKYRKSCYTTGVKPVIEEYILLNTFDDLAALPEVVETRKLTLQERCKYRKSCYETGVLPEIDQSPEIVIAKEASTVIPSNIHDLKNLCKYRKSCYKEIADSATVDTVRNIRQRRVAEKEAHKKMLRRAKLRRRMRGRVDRENRPKTPKKIKPMKTADVSMEDEAEPVVIVKKKGKKSRQPKSEEDIAKPAGAEQEESQPLEKVVEESQPMEKDEEKMNKDDEKPEEHDIPPVVPKKKKTKKHAKAVKEDIPAVVEEPKEEETEKVIDTPIVQMEIPKEDKQEERHEKKKEKKSSKKNKKEKVLPVETPVAEEKPVEAEDENVDDLTHRQKKRDYCKYRKSCYESGEKPLVEQTVETLFSSFNKHVDSEFEKEARASKSESGEKLDCKYRKSCYETGILPDITAGTISRDAEKPSFKEITSGSSRKLLCKYRKSCYEEMGIDDGIDQVTVTEEARKPTIKTVAKEHKAAPDSKTEDSSEEKEDDEDERKEEKRDMNMADLEDHQTHLDVDQKLDCKYRRSCYGSIKPRAKKEDHSGSMARQTSSHLRTKCHKYYLSCREQLGLPIKEKAPMGPNGRRLCRKKKE